MHDDVICFCAEIDLLLKIKRCKYLFVLTNRKYFQKEHNFLINWIEGNQKAKTIPHEEIVRIKQNSFTSFTCYHNNFSFFNSIAMQHSMKANKQ